jgi:hypothetical protein
MVVELSVISAVRTPSGKLGVIEEGAYADILLVNGNPLEADNQRANEGCPLYPSKQTLPGGTLMSALCQERS